MAIKFIAAVAAVIFTAGFVSTSNAHNVYSFSSSSAGQHFVPAVGDSPTQGFLTLVSNGGAYTG